MGVVRSAFVRAAAVLLAGCLLLAGASGAQPAVTGKPARIYGVEVESSPVRDRLLVFADGFLRPAITEVDAQTLMLAFPGATLDPSTPREVTPDPGGMVNSVTVFETADEPHEVRMTILRSSHVSPSISQRGGQVAIDFPRPVARRPPGAAAPRTLEARWIGMKTTSAIERLSRFLERRVIIDATTLTGTVSIEAPDPITPDEAATLFDAVLLLKNMAAVAGPGGVLKIVPLATFPGPWVETLEGEPGGAALVTLVRLEAVDAELASQALEPLVGKNGFLQVYPPANGILLAGVESRIARIVRVLRELDSEGATRVVIVPLHYADAEQTEDVVLDAFEQERSLRVWSDERTQRLIVRGRHETLERVREFVARIDRPAAGHGEIQVIPIEYADPDQIAKMLEQLAAQSAAAPVVRGAESLAGRQFTVSVHKPTHALVVQADPSTISVIRDLLAEIDRPPDRVRVEVGVTEISLSTDLALSFDGIAPLTSPKNINDLISFVVLDPSGAALSTTPNGSVFGRIARSPILVPIVDPTTGQTLVLPIPRETAVFTANDHEVRSRIIMQPQLLLISGEEDELFVGDNIPVPASTAGATTNPLRTSQSVERRDTGVDLRVTPTVPSEGEIQLELHVKLSALSGTVSTGPTFIERNLEATIRLESGRTAVIGSAQIPTRDETVVGTPFLMDIPFFGWFFRSVKTTERNTYLLITASAVRDHPDAKVLTHWMLQQLSDDEEAVASSAP